MSELAKDMGVEQYKRIESNPHFRGQHANIMSFIAASSKNPEIHRTSYQNSRKLGVIHPSQFEYLTHTRDTDIIRQAHQDAEQGKIGFDPTARRRNEPPQTYAEFGHHAIHAMIARNPHTPHDVLRDITRKLKPEEPASKFAIREIMKRARETHAR